MSLWTFLAKGREVGELNRLVMIEKVLKRKNLYKAYRQVVRNKGSAGVVGMEVTDLFSYLENNRDCIATSILNHTYVPQPIMGRTKRELRAGRCGATQE